MGTPDIAFYEVKPAAAMDVALRRKRPLVDGCLRVQHQNQDRITTLAVSCYLQGVDDGHRAAESHMHQKPTVGRVVHYYPKDDALRARKAQPYAALITHVRGDSCVNLAVQGDGSFPLPEEERFPTSVPFHADEQSGPLPGTWTWPPRV